MTGQITQMEQHRDNFHQIHIVFWENGHIIRTESDGWNSERSWHEEQQFHELTPWQKQVSLNDWLNDKAKFDGRIVDTLSGGR